MSLQSAIDLAARYLVDMQAKDGAWIDFNLPVGRSDAWTTAYVGMCLFEAEPFVSARERRYVRAALEVAARHLVAARGSEGTWGYNARVPPDCDSTSWATLFLTAMGRGPDQETFAALRTFARADGGFATYNVGPASSESSAWTRSHPDVTPVAAGALAATGAIDGATLEAMLAQRGGDGLWPSYWYRTALYSTLHNLITLHAAGVAVEPPDTATVAALAAQNDPFDLALALEISARFGAERDAAFVRDGAAKLPALQSPEGWWSGAPMLRVTDDAVDRPWDLPPGEAAGLLYRDDYYLFTTATVTRASSVLLRDRVGAAEDPRGGLS
jgi:hypothetical protein